MSPHIRGRSAHHDQRRTAIADAFLEVVADRGLPAASLRAVAEQASVSLGRVQHYFPTKERLLEAAFDRANDRSSARIANHLGGDPDQGPGRDVLTVVLTELVPHDAFSWTHLRVRQSFIARGLNDDRIAARLRDDYARLQRRLGAVVQREQDRGAIDRHLAPTTVATRLVAHAEGLTTHVLLGVTTPDQARAAIHASIDEHYT